MVKWSLTTVLLLVASMSYGQYRHQLLKDTSAYINRSFTIIRIDNQPDRKVYNYIIDTRNIDSIRFDSTAGKPNNFESFIKLNKKVKLLDISQLLAKYHIENYHNLPVYIDSAIVFRPESACFQLSAIKSVKVQKEKDTHLKYISINSIYHTDNPISDVYVFGTFTRPKDKN